MRNAVRTGDSFKEELNSMFRSFFFSFLLWGLYWPGPDEPLRKINLPTSPKKLKEFDGATLIPLKSCLIGSTYVLKAKELSGVRRKLRRESFSKRLKSQCLPIRKE